MSTMNISLPAALRSFVEEQVATRGYSTTSKYMRELIRKDKELQAFRRLLLDGAQSGQDAPIDDSYWNRFQVRVRQHEAE